MNKEEMMKKYAKDDEKDTLVFTGADCAAIVDILASSPVKRIIALSCVNHPYLRGWLKNNGYIIYGEELWKEDDVFCEATAAVIENKASEDELREVRNEAISEVFFYGTEELHNELPLMLRIHNNQVLPEFLYSKFEEIEKIINEINDLELSSPLSDELAQKRGDAAFKKQQLGIMGNSWYPID